MPRVAADPSAYLDALVAARRKAKAGTVVNAAELARATGATWRIIEAWISKDATFPVAARGGQGTPWRFELVPVLDHLIKQARSLVTARKARRAATSRLAGFGGSGDVPPSAPATAGPGTAAAEQADRTAEARGLKALAEAQMMTHRLKQMQGEYVRRDVTDALLADLMTTMQTETLAISTTLDPAGHWSPELRSSVDAALRTVLITVQDRLDAKLLEWEKNARA